MPTWKSRPSQCTAVVQKKVKRTGAFCSAGTRMSTYSWPVPMDVESVSWACFHSLQVQYNRNGEAAWIRKVPRTGSERTRRLNFQLQFAYLRPINGRVVDLVQDALGDGKPDPTQSKRSSLRACRCASSGFYPRTAAFVTRSQTSTATNHDLLFP